MWHCCSHSHNEHSSFNWSGHSSEHAAQPGAVPAAPLVLYMLVFYALPVIAMLLRSVSDPHWTLDNYRQLCQRQRVPDTCSGTRLRIAFVGDRRHAAARLSGGARAVAPARRLGGRGPDHRAAAVLDQRAGAQLRLDGAARPPWPDQRGAARHRPDRRAAAPAEHARSPCTSR